MGQFATLLFALTFPAYFCYAGIRESLDFHAIARAATHIVVATEGPKVDGVLTVVESWKGDLRRGEMLTIPPLAYFTTPDSPDSSSLIPPIPPELASKAEHQMILFLKKSAEFAGPSESKLIGESSVSVQWLPACYASYFYVSRRGGGPDELDAERFRMSTAWIIDGKVHIFRQEENPGPLKLSDTELGEVQLKEQVERDVAAVSGLDKLANTADPATRAKLLLPFVTPDENDDAKIQVAFHAFGSCGYYALPALRGMIASDKDIRLHAKALNQIASIGRKKAAPEIVEYLERQLIFLRATSALQSSDPDDTDPNPRGLHLQSVKEAVNCLARLRYKEGRDVVIDATHVLGMNDEACNSYFCGIGEDLYGIRRDR